MSNNEKKYTNTKLNISSSLAELRSQLKSKIFRKMRYGMKRQIPIKNRNMQYWIPARFLINPMSGVPFQSNKARNSDGIKNSIRTARSAIHLVSFFSPLPKNLPLEYVLRFRIPFQRKLDSRRFVMVNAGRRGATLDLRGLHTLDCNVRSPCKRARSNSTCYVFCDWTSQSIQFRRNRFIIKMSSPRSSIISSLVSF